MNIWLTPPLPSFRIRQVRNQLAPHVKVNHFRNHYELTRKDHMVKNFKRMVSNLRREDRASEAAQVSQLRRAEMLMLHGVFSANMQILTTQETYSTTFSR